MKYFARIMAAIFIIIIAAMSLLGQSDIAEITRLGFIGVIFAIIGIND